MFLDVTSDAWGKAEASEKEIKVKIERNKNPQRLSFGSTYVLWLRR